MTGEKEDQITHKLRFLKGFECPRPDIFHKIYFELTKPYLEGKKVLNIGCWTGNYETMFRNEDCQVISIDLDFNALQTARKANSHCEFLAANALQLPFKKRSFEVVTLFTVLEHLPLGSEERVFKEINNVLKDGGILVITTPNNNFIGNILDIAHWIVGHRHYKVKNLKEVLNRCSFQIESILLRGRFWSNFSIAFFYLFKYLFRLNIYMNCFVARILMAEYSKDGYRDIFMVCRKTIKRED